MTLTNFWFTWWTEVLLIADFSSDKIKENIYDKVMLKNLLFKLNRTEADITAWSYFSLLFKEMTLFFKNFLETYVLIFQCPPLGTYNPQGIPGQQYPAMPGQMGQVPPQQYQMPYAPPQGQPPYNQMLYNQPNMIPGYPGQPPIQCKCTKQFWIKKKCMFANINWWRILCAIFA